MLATAVAGAGASAEPVPPSEGTAKAEAKAVSAPEKKLPRNRGRYTSDEYPRRSGEVVNPHMWPVRAKIAKIRRGEREPTQNNALGAGHQPTQANTGGRRGTGATTAGPDEGDAAIFHGGEDARSTPVVFRGRLCERDRKSTFLLALLLRY